MKITDSNECPSTEILRYAVIGVGAGIFTEHLKGLQAVAANIVGVNDQNSEAGEARAAELGCPFFADYRVMLAETQPDVVVIITPHGFHAQLTIDSLEAGSHVLVEKPMAFHVAEADAMIEAARRANRLLAVNFQQRYRPEIQAAYQLIQEGRLGIIQYIEMICLWPRTLTYYSGGGWRATWIGEGGGVLMNQAPHNLDLLCHLMGMPRRVFAWTRTLLHKIAVEDTAQAMLEWDSGAIGSFHASTAETGLPERLEIVGTKGYLQIGKGQLTFNELEIDLREHILTSNERFVGPRANPVQVEIGAGAGNHVAVYQHLQDSIRNGAPLLIDGTAGRMSLELANAMIYSGHIGQPVTFPLDRQQYAQLLTSLQAQTNMSSLSQR